MSWKMPFKPRWVYRVGFLFSGFPVSVLLLIWSNDFSVMRKKSQIMPHAIDFTVNLGGWRLSWERKLWVYLWGSFQIGRSEERWPTLNVGITIPWTGVLGWTQNTKEVNWAAAPFFAPCFLAADALRPAASPSRCHACPLVSSHCETKDSLPPWRYVHQVSCYSKEKNNACTPNPTNKPAELPEPYVKFDQALLVQERTVRGLCFSPASSQALAHSFFTVNGSLDPACLGNRCDGPCKMKHLLFANIASTNLKRMFAHTKLSQRVRWPRIAKWGGCRSANNFFL